MLKSLHHAGTKLEMMLPYKIVNSNKRVAVSRAFNIIFILVYYGLYTMTIDVVTRRIIKKWCIWSLHLRNFLWLSVFALFLQKIHGSSSIFLNFIYIYKIEIRNSETYLPEVSVYSIDHNGWGSRHLWMSGSIFQLQV